jgi:hypothetical protein
MTDLFISCCTQHTKSCMIRCPATTNRPVREFYFECIFPQTLSNLRGPLHAGRQLWRTGAGNIGLREVCALVKQWDRSDFGQRVAKNVAEV